MQPPGVDNENSQVSDGNKIEYTLRVQNPQEQRLCDNYRVNFNTVEFEGPIIFPSLPPGHTFVLTSSQMQILTTRGSFYSQASENTHGHMSKLRSVCKSCVQRPDLDMTVLGLTVFPPSLIGNVAVWFSELPYSLIHTRDQWHKMFMETYFPLYNQLNHKEKLNNVVALPGEYVINSCDRFTALLISVPNQHIDNESLKEHFYRVLDDNGKIVIDTNEQDHMVSALLKRSLRS